MNCNATIGVKIAEEALKAMSGQLDQMHGLALATLGATIALLVQVAIHNTKEPSRKLNPRAPGWLLASMIFQTLSLLFGILAKGSLTSSIPTILTADFCVSTNIDSGAYPGATQVTLFAALQGYAFFLGIAVVGWVLWKNKGAIEEGSEQ